MQIKSFMQKDRYGNEIAVEFAEVPPMMTPKYDHPGDPKGTDTVPAWLTPGEYVINAEATRKYEPLLEEINEEGKEMQAAQGGSIPSYVFSGGMINNLSSLYRSEGGSTPSWLTDELLDSIMQVESGGDVEAKSSAGALGPYQIMPATAAQPGYGVTPLSQEELTDPVKSREFARSYLAGIAANNPDYTMEEVLQAYNAGPGRIARFKAGEGDPLTQETIEYPIKVMANLQTKKEPGIVDSILSMLNPVSTAEAATIVPEVPAEEQPPVPAVGISGDPSLDEGATFGEYKAETVIPPTAEPSVVAVSDNAALDEEEIPINRPGLGISGDPSLDEGASTGMEDLPPPPPKEKEKEKPVSENDALIQGIIEDTKDSNSPGAGEGDQVSKAGRDLIESDPSLAQRIFGFIREAAGEMFDGKELARMAINYAGSRALGYDHKGSLNYAAKSYVTRNEDQQKRMVDAVEANRSAYTVQSYNRFMQTLNPDDLIPKPGTQKLGDMMYTPDYGLQQAVTINDVPYIRVDHDDDPNTPPKLINAINAGAVKAKDSLHDSETVFNQFVERMKLIENRVNSGREKEKRVDLDSATTADAAKDLYFDMMMRYGADPANASKVKTAMTRALEKWGDAVFAYKTGNRDTDPTNSLKAFFVAETITQTTGLMPTKFGDTDPQFILEVHKYAENRLPSTEAYQAYWKELERIYFSAQAKKANMRGFTDEKAEDGYNGFLWFVRNFQLANGDPNNPAVQFYNENK